MHPNVAIWAETKGWGHLCTLDTYLVPLLARLFALGNSLNLLDFVTGTTSTVFVPFSNDFHKTAKMISMMSTSAWH